MKSGWQSKPLAEVLVRTETVNPTLTPATEFEYIDVSSVSNSTFTIDQTQTLKGKDAPSRARKLVRTNDVLFATIRPTLQRIAVVPDELDQQVCSTGYIVLRPAEYLSYKYLYYFLFTDAFMGAMQTLQKGASYPAVTDGEVKAQPIAYPPLPEQQRIVSILDKAFEGVATATANAEKNLSNARELFDSTLESVFSTHHNGWVSKELADLCDIRHGFAFVGDDFLNSTDLTAPIVLTPGNFTEYGLLNFTDKNTKRYFGSSPDNFRFKRGDLVVVMTDLSSKMKILGKPALIDRDDVLHNQRIGRFVFNDDVLNVKFLYYFLLTRGYLHSIKRSATGTMVKHTAPTRILSNMLLYPTNLDEQKSLVKMLDQLAEQTNKLQTAYQQKLDALAELKKSILHQAFTGQLH